MEVIWLGWCHEDNHDKVWGIALYQETPVNQGRCYSINTYATFWGRRGKKLQKKLKEMTSYDANKLVTSKMDKGYQAYPPEEAAKIYEHLPKEIFKVALTVK